MSNLMKQNRNYMLDTNIFNRRVQEKIGANALHGAHLYVTHNQWDELQQTQDADKRNQLMEFFQQIDAHEVATNSFFLGVSIPGKAKLSDGNSPFNAMLTLLKELDAKARKKPRRVSNQRRDILIAETAIRLNHTLVTNDENLTSVARKFGGQSIDLETLLSHLAN